MIKTEWNRTSDFGHRYIVLSQQQWSFLLIFMQNISYDVQIGSLFELI